MQTLSAPLLRELIDHINVYETESKGKSRTQHIVINYRFVRYVEIPDSVFKSNYKADTRQGVAVEYVSEIRYGITAFFKRKKSRMYITKKIKKKEIECS